MNSTRLSLIEGLKDRNREAWARFASVYQAAIRSWAFGYSCHLDFPAARSREMAEEVSQELLTAIQQKVRSFDFARRRPGGFRAWLKTTTCNLVVSYVRQNAKHWGSGDSAVLARLLEEPAKADLESEIDNELERQILEQVKQELRDASPKECAMVDELGWGDGRSKDPTAPSPKVIAEKHGTTASALLKVKSRLKKSLEYKVSRLRKQMN